MTAIPAASYLVEFGSRSRAGEPADDAAGRIEEAFARGMAEGKAAARREYEAELDRRNEAFAQKLASEREAWAAETAEKLAVQMAAGMRSIEESIANSLAHVLEPFLIAELRRQAIDELVGIMRGLAAKDGAVSLEVCGPEGLLAEVRDRLADDGLMVRFTPGEARDVRVHADQTILETRLGTWVEKIKGAVR
ncbi:MAG TPA: hypothetical protein VNK52_16495 [Hyphomicrobiaceae bacterium]|nr:hypothetical protein [Hyphomicrobiaceae bacterium]